MIPVLVKSLWLRNICFSKVATTLFKFTGVFLNMVVALPETQVCHRSYIISASFLWVSSTNKTDCHYKTEILLKVALNTINKPKPNIIDLLHIPVLILKLYTFIPFL
jgi:hypothetical protein